MMQKYAGSAKAKCPEIPERVHPHLWRHTRATHLYQIETLIRSVKTPSLYRVLPLLDIASRGFDVFALFVIPNFLNYSDFFSSSGVLYYILWLNFCGSYGFRFPKPIP